MSARILPYALSWTVLAVLMIVGMNRLPFSLYGPIDGAWAKWNVEAILHFSKIFDLSPYSHTLLCAPDGGIERRDRGAARVRAHRRLATQRCSVHRLSRPIRFRAAVGALQLHFCRACLHRDRCRSHPGATAAARRM